MISNYRSLIAGVLVQSFTLPIHVNTPLLPVNKSGHRQCPLQRLVRRHGFGHMRLLTSIRLPSGSRK